MYKNGEKQAMKGLREQQSLTHLANGPKLNPKLLKIAIVTDDIRCYL